MAHKLSPRVVDRHEHLLFTPALAQQGRALDGPVGLLGLLVAQRFLGLTVQRCRIAQQGGRTPQVEGHGLLGAYLFKQRFKQAVGKVDVLVARPVGPVALEKKIGNFNGLALLGQARQHLLGRKVAPLGGKPLVQKKVAVLYILRGNALPCIIHILADAKAAGKGRGIFKQGAQRVALTVGVQKTQSLGHAWIPFGGACPGAAWPRPVSRPLPCRWRFARLFQKR